MNGMFDATDKEYLDLKFGDVIKEVRDTTKQNTSDIIEIARDVNTLVIFKDDHVKDHEKADTNKKWRWDNIIVVAIACATVLAAKFL